MKELSIEDKAKRYDEAIERAKQLSKELTVDDIFEQIFPELKESEDERIRKDIIVLIKDWWDRVNKDNISTKEQMLAWLEKQGEQKPAWSEDDENGLADAIWAIKQARTIAKDENDMGNLWCAENWLKSLKDRVQPQPKQEWSEEDEEHLSDAIFFVREYQIPTRDKRLLNAAKEAEDWLKSLRPQSQWKPSDEQMKGIECAIKTLQHQLNVGDKRLNSLYDALKKLKG